MGAPAESSTLVQKGEVYGFYAPLLALFDGLEFPAAASFHTQVLKRRHPTSSELG